VIFLSLACWVGFISFFRDSSSDRNSVLLLVSTAGRMLSACMGMSRGMHFFSWAMRMGNIFCLYGLSVAATFARVFMPQTTVISEPWFTALMTSSIFAHICLGFFSAIVAKPIMAPQTMRLFLLFRSFRKSSA